MKTETTGTSTPAGKITVILAEDHTIVREGLRALLNVERDIEVVGEAETGRQAVELARTLRPAVVVMDIGMPLLNGLEAGRQILQTMPAAKLLFLSAHNDMEFFEQVNAIGAMGYLIKQTSGAILAKAIREVHKGHKFYSPSITRYIQNQLRKLPPGQRPAKNPGPRLTSREVEVLQLVAEGQPNKQIAEELNISIKTVEKHRHNLMDKLNIHDTASLTRYAIAAGIIEGGTNTI